jgi:heat-inducible transcriptional repressor
MMLSSINEDKGMGSDIKSELNERDKEILRVVVDTYISSGKPVGSRALSRKSRDRLSAATIRNIMSDLEEMGYLTHPHTSAGRIPTDEGYRFYVDHLMVSSKLDQAEEKLISNRLFNMDSHDSVMERLSDVISQVSDNLGFVISPSLDQNRLKHIEFILMGEGKILLIFVSRSGLVQNRIIQVDDNFRQSDLDQTGRYLNENYSGQTLWSIRNELLQKMKEEKALYDQILKNAMLLCNCGLIDEVSGQDVDIYLDGASNLMTKPEFSDMERLRTLFRTFEEKGKLVKILNACLHYRPGEGVKIIIGSEISVPAMKNYSLISAPLLRADPQFGSVGILGPTRIEYARAISLVDYVAKLFGQMLNQT